VIDVAAAADEAYAPHAATLFHSLLVGNDPASVRVHLLHPPEFSARTIRRIDAMVEGMGASAEFHRIDGAAVQGLPSAGRISRVMWYRLLLPDLLPHAERVLYLDCDTLVLDQLAPLWEMDISDSALAAVSNVFPMDLRRRPEQLGIEQHSYFNSGVLLMNLEVWRGRSYGEQIGRLARDQAERLIFPDQDALNLVLGSQRINLHPRWNAQNSVFYFPWAVEVFGEQMVAEARTDPAIVHFEGPAYAKPWHYGSTHPYQQRYLEHRAQTPWPRVRLEGTPLAERFRRLIRRGRG
jgi:UDP-glucose/galactose:(glucosyl)LPS alpha-1,2-glucosyl/galactosyltransferase